MFRNLADWLNSVNSARNWVRSKYPDEDILFASAATILEMRGASPVGWSLKRFLQRRGTVVFTRKQVFLRSSFFSLFTLFHLVMVVSFLALSFKTQDFTYLILSLPFGLLILQRLPYQKQIRVESIASVNLGSVQGITGRGSLLTIALADRAINIVPAQILPEEVVQLLPMSAD